MIRLSLLATLLSCAEPSKFRQERGPSESTSQFTLPAKPDPKKEATAEALRRQLESPNLSPDGYYLVTPFQLFRLLAPGNAPLKWIGAPVQFEGVVVRAGDGDEASVRRLNAGKAFLIVGGPPREDLPAPPIVICELDTKQPPALAPGDAIVARGEVWGTVPVGIPDVHCTSIARQ